MHCDRKPKLEVIAEAFLDHIPLFCRAQGLPPPVREHPFAAAYGRQWRFDFAWPALLLAAEVEGGTRNQGRHSRHDGYEGDCAKYNFAALLGWTVLRFTTDMVRDGRAFDAIEWALAGGNDGDQK